VLAHRLPQLRKRVREAHELVELGLLLLGAVLRVVEVLASSGRVDPRRLQLRAGARRDPHVLPRRRDHERLDSLDLRRVVDRPPG
jgi:hypothetical protein